MSSTQTIRLDRDAREALCALGELPRGTRIERHFLRATLQNGSAVRCVVLPLEEARACDVAGTIPDRIRGLRADRLIAGPTYPDGLVQNVANYLSGFRPIPVERPNHA